MYHSVCVSLLLLLLNFVANNKFAVGGFNLKKCITDMIDIIFKQFHTITIILFGCRGGLFNQHCDVTKLKLGGD